MKLDRGFKIFKRRKPGRIKQGFLGVCLATALFTSAAANPTGPTVSHGQVQISPGLQTQIQQLTDKAIVDWQSFSIGADESVRILQPSLQSVILNRVVGQDPSNILGTLEANGNVFLINPNGILFGPHSVVNVGGLVASTLGLSNEDFIAGNYRFNLEDASNLAPVINQGTIRISDAGYAVLTGPTVINEGVIVAKVGKVVLGAGERATLNLDGRDLIHFALADQVSEGITLLTPGSVSEALLDILGVAANRRADQLVRNSDGSIHLKNSSGTAVQAGTVRADGDSGQTAGSILIDSSDLSLVTPNSVTSASGRGDNSAGGDVLILSYMDGNQSSRGFTDIQSGSLLAAAGTGTGDGGFIEVSGDGLNLHGAIDLSSESGRTGDFLLDPVNVTIVDGENAPTTVANPLVFDDSTNTTSTIIGDRWFRTLAFNSLTLESSGDIVFDQSIAGINPLYDNIVDFSRSTLRTGITLKAIDGKIDFGDNSTSYIGLDDFTLEAGGDIDFGDSTFTISRLFNVTAGGDINFDRSTINQLAATPGSQLIEATGKIDLGTSNIVFDSGFGGFPLDTVISAGTGITSAAADGTGTHSGSLTIDGGLTLSTTSGDIELFDFDIDVLSASAGLGLGNNFTATALNGTVDFGESSLNVQGGISVTASEDILLGNNVVDSSVLDLISLDAGGDIRLDSSLINQNLAFTQASGFVAKAGGNIVLDTTQIKVGQVSRNDNFDLIAGGDIDLGDATINAYLSAPNDGVTISAGGRINLGTSHLNLDSSFGGFPLDTVISAGTGITSAAADGTGTHSGSLTIDGGLTLSTTSGDIELFDFDIDVLSARAGLGLGNNFTATALNGTVDFGESSLNVQGGLSVTASEDILLGNNVVDSSVLDLISLDAGGDIRLDNSLINQNLAFTQASGFVAKAGGNIVLDTTQIKVGQVSRNDNFDLIAGGDIDLGDATINAYLSAPNDGVTISAGGRINLGTSHLNLDSSFGGFPLDTVISAGTGITSAAADGTGTHSGSLMLDGGLTLSTTSGDIELFDFDIDVLSARSGLDIGNDLLIEALAGSISLGESSIDAQGAIRFDSSNVVDFGTSRTTISAVTRNLTVVADNHLNVSSAEVLVPGRLLLLTNGFLSANTSSLNAADIEVFGFDSATRAVDYTIAVPGSVELSLESPSNIDLSIYATDDITVRHTGGGSLSLERAGIEGSGGIGSPGAVRSVNGDITINSTGEVRLGKAGSDIGNPLVEAFSATATVSLTADVITDVTSGELADIRSGGLVELRGTTGVGTATNPVEVSGRGITLDLSSGTANSGYLHIVEDSDFLKVVANNSRVDITELDALRLNNKLQLQPGVGQDELTIDPLGIENIVVIDGVDISVGPISVSSGQSLALQAINGSDIFERSGVPGNIDSKGNLLLQAGGSIGTSTAPILVNGGTVAAQAGTSAGHELHIASLDTDLSVGRVSINDPLGGIAASGRGFSSGGDLVAQVGGKLPANLTTSEDITSSTGGVVLRVLEGDIRQTGGTISGQRVGLDVNGNVGSYSASSEVEVSVQTAQLALNVTGDAILDQATGDLSVVAGVSAGGQTVTHSGASGNLRIQNNNGSLNINAATRAGQDMALVTGNSLTVNAQALPNSITLNGDLTAGANIVIIANGDIIQSSGTVSAPNLGLGARGSVGTPTRPVDVETDNLALNPLDGEVTDPDGYTAVPRVTAVGATVNQGVRPTPPPPPVPVTPDPAPLSSSSHIDILPSSLAQDNVDLVEDTLRAILAENAQIEDPTQPPAEPSEDDFLQRKYRR